MNVNIPGFGLGWLIALLVLVLAVGFAVFGHVLTKDWILGFIAALAVARMVP